MKEVACGILRLSHEVTYDGHAIDLATRPYPRTGYGREVPLTNDGRDQSGRKSRSETKVVFLRAAH
jgi:hypothetical protein